MQAESIVKSILISKTKNMLVSYSPKAMGFF